MPNVEAMAPPAATETVSEQATVRHGCQPDNDGQFNSIRNAHVTYGDVSVDDVVVQFHVDGLQLYGGDGVSPGVFWDIVSIRCPNTSSDHSDLPADFRTRSFEAQMQVLRERLAATLMQYAEDCAIDIPPEPFLGPGLEAFLGEAGQGMWLEADGNSYRTIGG